MVTDEELEAAKKQEAELRSKIKDLEQPLVDIDAIVLSDPELAQVQVQIAEAEHTARLLEDAQNDGPCSMDAEDIPKDNQVDTSKPIDDAAIREEAAERLRNRDDAAQRDTLQEQREHHKGAARAPDHEALPRVFGSVPAFQPLPADPTVSMILSCNRFTCSMSHEETFRHMPERLKSRVQNAQHFMSGRQHVMYVRPDTGALWSLPGVRDSLDEHNQQVCGCLLIFSSSGN